MTGKQQEMKMYLGVFILVCITFGVVVTDEGNKIITSYLIICHSYMASEADHLLQ